MLSTRPFVALAAAALALAPAVLTPAHQPPRVLVSDVALTGIGQDIYYAITPVVQEAVGGVSYLVNFVPIVGGPVAAQININYFQGIQPVVEATVNYAAAVVQDPLNVLPATAAYGGTIYDIGYNWVSAEAVFFGLPPLPPRPPIRHTATAGVSASKTAARAVSAAKPQPRQAARVAAKKAHTTARATS